MRHSTQNQFQSATQSLFEEDYDNQQGDNLLTLDYALTGDVIFSNNYETGYTDNPDAIFVEPAHLLTCGCPGCGAHQAEEAGWIVTEADEAADPVAAVEGTISLLGGGGTITYYFGDMGFTTYYSDNFATTPSEWIGEEDWTSTEKANVREALDDIEEMIDVTFVESATWTGLSDADFTIFKNDDSGSLGTAGTYSNSSQAWSDIRINHTISSRWTSGGHKGGQGYETLVHEIGHALGLGHTHDTGFGSEILKGMTGLSAFVAGPDGLNDPINSIMAYRDGWAEMGTSSVTMGNRGNYGAWDAKALQNRYGENTTNASGSDTYTLPTSSVSGTTFETIWDTGGTDTITAASSSVAATIDLRAATLDYTSTSGGPVNYVTGIVGGFTIASGSVIENGTGGSAADTITGNSADNTLTGNGGDDTIVGSAGSDTLSGGAGSDTVSYINSSASVTVNLFSGSGSGGDAAGDTYSSIENVTGSDFGDNFYANSSGNDFDGGDGTTDWVRYSNSTAAVTVNLLTGVGSGGHAGSDTYANLERIQGSSFGDTLTGTDGINRIEGRDGDDSLYGRSGNDVLLGGDGADYINGGGAVDWVYYDDSAAGVTVNLSTGTGSGGTAAGDTYSGVERILGSDFADTLTGNSAGNYLRGGAGADSLFGDAAGDLLSGGDGADALDGGAGFDWAYYVFSTAGVSVNLATGATSGGEAAGDTFTSIERIRGSDFADTLTGDSGNNWFRGGDGADTLQGGTGRDLLQGEGGADVYVFDAGDVFARVRGFEDDVDSFDLSDYGFASQAAAAAFMSDVGSSVYFDHSGERVIIESMTVAALTDDIVI
ncbi:MAG: M12 family metallo-peptidase [bacterium]